MIKCSTKQAKTRKDRISGTLRAHSDAIRRDVGPPQISRLFCSEISEICSTLKYNVPRSSNTALVLESVVVCHRAYPRANLSLFAPPSSPEKLRVKPQPGVGQLSLHFSVRKVAFLCPALRRIHPALSDCSSVAGVT